jgi:hypothetical protein
VFFCVRGKVRLCIPCRESLDGAWGSSKRRDEVDESGEWEGSGRNRTEQIAKKKMRKTKAGRAMRLELSGTWERVTTITMKVNRRGSVT